LKITWLRNRNYAQHSILDSARRTSHVPLPAISLYGAFFVKEFARAANLLSFESIELDARVPSDIRGQFDIARNAFVYSWFVYEFASLAEKQSFTVLEMALRRRAHLDESPNTSRSPGLRRLLNAATERGWLRAADFKIPSFSGSDGTLSRLDLLLEFRNHALHGNIHLLPQEPP
jgi:hypothetical protein